MSTTISPHPISDPSRRTATAPALGFIVVESRHAALLVTLETHAAAPRARS